MKSLQQKLHWEKLQLLGMCAHMRGSLSYIKKTAHNVNTLDVFEKIEELEKRIKREYKIKMRERKFIDAMIRMHKNGR